MLNKRHEDTGRWILQTEEFPRWFHQDHDSLQDQRTLFYYSTQGADKTVILAVFINELWQSLKRDFTAGIASFYSNYRDQVTYDEVLASLPRKLLGENTSEFKALCGKEGEETPRKDEDWGLLAKSISNLLGVFFVIDALDETLSFDRVFSIQERDMTYPFLWHLERFRSFPIYLIKLLSSNTWMSGRYWKVLEGNGLPEYDWLSPR